MTDLTAALAEALAKVLRGGNWTPFDSAESDAAIMSKRIVAALPPTITDALALGTAWAAVTDVLPPGVQVVMFTMGHDGPAYAQLMHEEKGEEEMVPFVTELIYPRHGRSYAAALLALAARLTEVTHGD